MNLDELKKEIEEKFEAEWKYAEGWDENSDGELSYYISKDQIKTLFIQSLEEAYKAGEENKKAKIREWADTKANFLGNMDAKTLSPNDLKEELNKP